jgi:hypothetical protein
MGGEITIPRGKLPRLASRVKHSDAAIATFWGRPPRLPEFKPCETQGE